MRCGAWRSSVRACSKGRKRSWIDDAEVNDIFKYIPHRYPFLLVDRILEIHGDEKIVGIKNVIINETFLSRPFSAPPGDAGSADL